MEIYKELHKLLNDSKNDSYMDSIFEILIKLYVIHKLFRDHSKAEREYLDAMFYLKNLDKE